MISQKGTLSPPKPIHFHFPRTLYTILEAELGHREPRVMKRLGHRGFVRSDSLFGLIPRKSFSGKTTRSLYPWQHGDYSARRRKSLVQSMTQSSVIRSSHESGSQTKVCFTTHTRSTGSSTWFTNTHPNLIQILFQFIISQIGRSLPKSNPHSASFWSIYLILSLSLSLREADV